MARLIDAIQTIIKMSGRITPLIQMGANPIQVYNEALQVVADAPTVDAVEVVRCLDCKWYQIRRLNDTKPEYDCIKTHALLDVSPDDFCSYGERKDGDVV